ncbi:MAG: hypothetical protein AAGD14_13115 [Planctomycetota bacterium]
MKQLKRFPRGALKRYAEVLLRQIHQCGGRERYVPLTELEDELGLEPWLILHLCRTKLVGEVHVAYRTPVALDESLAMEGAAEREIIRLCFRWAHVRIRHEAVRWTEDELLQPPRESKKKQKQKKKKKR